SRAGDSHVAQAPVVGVAEHVVLSRGDEIDELAVPVVADGALEAREEEGRGHRRPPTVATADAEARRDARRATAPIVRAPSATMPAYASTSGVRIRRSVAESRSQRPIRRK